MSVLPPPAEKASYVQRMFSELAPGYDRLNRVMTFGMDAGWRKLVVETIAPLANGRALDVGTGTGDFLPLLAAWMPDGIAVGLDFALPMMQAGWPKVAGVMDRNQITATNVQVPSGAAPAAGTAAFVGGDALHLPFPDQTFDVLTTGFVLRNVTDIAATLHEMWRVTRPGGVMACLEVARPEQPLLRAGHWLYFQQLVPIIAGAFGGDRQFYTYLPQSARHFPPPPELAKLMQAAGWEFVHYRLLGLGAVALHLGVRLA